MSLPDGKLTLQGFSQLGDANSKKHAMLLRLSTETMEALERLESGAKIDIDFSEGASKLYVGNTSFTMSNQPETVPHELYLRMVQPNKPGAMLKLQGSVVGKLRVERQLTSQTEAAVRGRTQQAESKRNERKIEVLEKPLAPPPKTTVKKSKAASKPTKSTPAGHAPPADPSRTISNSTSLQPSRVASPRISPRPSSAGGSENSARYRLIHFVALKPRTHEDILRLVGGQSKESRKEVQDLIPEVLERAGSSDGPQPTKWRLKDESWLEVRPFENLSLREEEVQNLIQRGQEALRRLYIPDSDPLWNNFRQGSTLATPAVRPVRQSPVPPPQPKKPVVVKRVPRTEATTRKRITDTIPMKDESVRPPKVDAMKAKEREETPTASASSTKPQPRRVPGSGFRTKSQSSTPPSLDNNGADAHVPPKRPGIDRDVKREIPSPVPGSSRPPSAMPPPTGKAVKRDEPESKKKITNDIREKKRPKKEPGEIELSPRKRPREIPESDYSDRDSVASLSFKKRKVEDLDSDRLPAKLKAENRDVAAVKKKYRDASPLPPRIKAEREPTPQMRSPVPVPRSPALPPRPPMHDRVPSVASNASRDSRREDAATRNGSAKPRRREPSFTSSEDEQPERKRGRSPGARGRERERDGAKKDGARRGGGVLPSDARALRRLYDERIPEFVALRSKKKRLREDMKRLERRMAAEGVDDFSTDYEVPDNDECEGLATAEAAAREECVRIRDALFRLTGQEIPGEDLWSEDTD
ncbi:hypothetical protein PsYK624_139530 [Phanerochaete sordida]|uniref:RNA polymerase II elongation factor ELL N-terminal domain-containing protein n=1 Tax=Phanerochaete sordida TaxID=48140 RepID=A0A9P3GLM6_9APHY|nr:hypothetical protein PsYK624_139530 [Phanerochaete sordida]